MVIHHSVMTNQEVIDAICDITSWNIYDKVAAGLIPQEYLGNINLLTHTIGIMCQNPEDIEETELSFLAAIPRWLVVNQPSKRMVKLIDGSSILWYLANEYPERGIFITMLWMVGSLSEDVRKACLGQLDSKYGTYETTHVFRSCC